MASNPEFFLILSAIIFCIGLVGLMIRRNPLVMFMSIELMLNASNLAFMTFGNSPKRWVTLMAAVPTDQPLLLWS